MSKRLWGKYLGRFQREISVAAAYAALLVLLAVAAPSFYQGAQLRNLLVSSAPALVMAVGMTLVILARQIDISIGSQLSICGVAAGLLAKTGLPMPVVFFAVMGIGGLLGVVNGVFVAMLGLPSIVVSLATMVIYREGLLWWREGEFVKELSTGFQWFGLGQEWGQAVIVGIAVVFFLSFAWGLRYLTAGRAVYATGSDPEAAFLVGVRPRRVVFSVFVIMGALSGLAALLASVQLPQVDPTAGKGLELEVIAAVVVGGVAISGGRGTLVGVLLGVALLSTIEPALVFFRIEASWGKVFEGAIILIAVASDALTFQRRKDGLGTVAN
jgi:rhamnose transport system permease protein